MIGHLIDAFLVSAVPIATDSERKRNSNPRKFYPADTGLIRAFDTGRRANVGHALETAVLIELERRGAEVGYVRTANGFEVDFLARYPDTRDELIQVSADVSDRQTLQREIRALTDAESEYPQAVRRLLVLDRDARSLVEVPDVLVQPAYEWLLDPPT